jgi:predicted PurR-regulated permease PerM
MAPPNDPPPETRESAPDKAKADRDFVARAARWAIVGGAVAAALFALLFVLKAALTPLAAAFVIAYLLDPLIDRLERFGVRRRFGILLVLGLTGAVVLGVLLVAIPRLVRELTSLAERMPGYLERLVTVVVPELETRLGVELPGTLEELLSGLRGTELSVLGAVRDLLLGALSTATGTVSVLVGLLVIPILAYYLLVEFDQVLRRVAEWIPRAQRDYVIEKARTADHLISGFLRGQLLVAAILGTLYALGFGVIGVDLAIGVGLLAGVMALVPYLGNVVAVGLASSLCVLEFGFDWHLLAVLGWYAVVQNLEGFVLTPRIVGGSVGLHPGAVIVALLIGGDLFGFLGLLIAVPAAAVVKVFVDELLEAYRRSTFFQGDEPELEPPAPDLDPPGFP